MKKCETTLDLETAICEKKVIPNLP